MSNVLSVRCWLAAVVGVCKLCHASADGGQESAWKGLWKEIPWPDSAALWVFASPSSLGMASALQGKHLFPTSLGMPWRNGRRAGQSGLWPHRGPFCPRQKRCSKHLAWDLDLATLQEQIYWWGLSGPLPFLSINTIQHMGGVTRWHGKLCSCPLRSCIQLWHPAHVLLQKPCWPLSREFKFFSPIWLRMV